MGQHLNVDFKIRLPHELKDKIRQSAKFHNRTMTADIVARIEQTFKDEPQNTTLQEILDEIKLIKSKLD